MSEYDHDLRRINGKINRWRAFEHLLLAMVVALTAWGVLAGLDVWLRPRFLARSLLASILPLLFLVMVCLLARVLTRRRTPAAVAAFLENKFPQLDNHLINRVLFAQDGASSPWLRLYLREGVPGLAALPLREIKNRKLRQRAGAALLVVVVALALPLYLLGNAWTISMQRVINPFSKLQPPTFAKVVEVVPGDKTVVQGDGVNLTVVGAGRAGQFVDIDVEPADDRRFTIRMGQFKVSGEPEEFTYRVSKVSSSVQYRFRVGDAYPTEVYTVDSVPPLALTGMRMEVTPPRYTGLEQRGFDILTNQVPIPAHSQVRFQVRGNRALTGVALVFKESRLELAAEREASLWGGSMVMSRESSFQVVARDSYGLEVRMPFALQLIDDRAPSIQLVSPASGKAVLPPGGKPSVQFEVNDDYGIGRVVLERVAAGSKPDVDGEPIKEWDAAGNRRLSENWIGELENLPPSTVLRIVAYDNADVEGAHRSVSPLIRFETSTLAAVMKAENEKRGEARKTLAMLVARQRTALSDTSRLRTELPGFDEEPWSDAARRQRAIRELAAELLKTRDSAIGTARAALRRALQDPLPEADSRLAHVVGGSSETRESNAEAAIKAQNTVLRLLVQADGSMNKGDVSQSAAGVLAMLEGIRKGQTANLTVSLRSAQANTALPEAIVDRQDNLAHDAQAMIGFCRAEAKADRADEEYGQLMNKIANKAEEVRLHPSMIDIAETMERDGAARSVPLQHSVTNKLAILIDYLKEWRESETREKTEDALAIIRDARQSLKKMEELQTSVVDALRETGSQGDKTANLDEELLEEILELKENMAQAMLKVATDLQALPELDAVNELVTDTFQTYEEMAQVKGSGTNAVTELGLQKEDWLLDTMMQTGQKADEMEMWLMATPDNIQRNMETIDKEEMKGAIGQITMPEELQDIIGDLMEQEEERMQEADDSVTNQGVANMEAGWGIAEGETVDYNAAGKSGNERPEHKDQDGRSQVGRQGMSDGEVMSRSGKINEGDNNLDKRRTQDSNQSGDVEEEGHTDAVASGGGKNSGYSQDKGMEGGDDATRRDTKVQGESPESTRAQLTRNAEAVYAQAQLSSLRTYDLKKYIEFSKHIDLLQKQKASPAMIAELHKKALQALAVTYASLESGVSSQEMGAAGSGAEADGAVSALPDEAPPEYREMVSEYFKAIGEL